MMLFVAVLAGSFAAVGALLWFTGWAEQRIVSPDAQPVEAKPR